MLRLSILVSFLTLFPVFLSTTILDSKPKPVDLAFTCTKDIDEDKSDIEHDTVPIILIHGLTGYKEIWHGVQEPLALKTKKKVCIADLRNHGESPWNDEEYNVTPMAEDVKHLLDRINAPKAIVLGHSLGGKIVVHLALTYPERVEKLIVEDMRPNGLSAESSKDLESFARDFLEIEKHIPQGLTEREAKEKVFNLIKENVIKINLNFTKINYIPIKCSNGKCRLSTNPVLLEAALRNEKELLNDISGCFEGPALFIYGTESNIKVNEDESNIMKLFPNAKLVAVEGAGHTVHTHKKFLREVIQFINNE